MTFIKSEEHLRFGESLLFNSTRSLSGGATPSTLTFGRNIAMGAVTLADEPGRYFLKIEHKGVEALKNPEEVPAHTVAMTDEDMEQLFRGWLRLRETYNDSGA